jgi:Ca2+-binding EF-hand superfamily protein
MRLKECFDIFDYDKSGEVSTEELSTAIKALGLEKEAGKILQIVAAQSTDV